MPTNDYLEELPLHLQVNDFTILAGFYQSRSDLVGGEIYLVEGTGRLSMVYKEAILLTNLRVPLCTLTSH